MIKSSICSGDKIILPDNKEYQDDIFVVIRTRSTRNSIILDAFCDGEESIMISIDQKEAQKI